MLAGFELPRASNVKSESARQSGDPNKRVNNFGHVLSVPSDPTMATSLNRIILSCFTGAEWRVKWRIVEDVLVGATT